MGYICLRWCDFHSYCLAYTFFITNTRYFEWQNCSVTRGTDQSRSIEQRFVDFLRKEKRTLSTVRWR